LTLIHSIALHCFDDFAFMLNAGGLLHSRGLGFFRRKNRAMVMPELAYQNEQFYPHGLKSISKGVPLANLHASADNVVDSFPCVTEFWRISYCLYSSDRAAAGL